jgi:hypothetical protein
MITSAGHEVRDNNKRLPSIAWPCIAVESISRRLRGSSTPTVPEAAAAAAVEAAVAGDTTGASSSRGARTAVVETGRTATAREFEVFCTAQKGKAVKMLHRGGLAWSS